MNNEISRDPSLDVKSMMSGQTPTHDVYHGQLVDLDDGSKGIVIDRQEELRKQAEPEAIGNIRKYLDDMDSRITDAKARAEGAIESRQQQEIDHLNKMNPNSESYKKMLEVQSAFANLEMSATGLAPAGSEEAIRYAEKQKALSDGLVNLDDYQNVKPVTDTEVVQPIQQEIEHTEPVDTDASDSVQFNVPENNVKNFVSTLDIKSRNKIEHSTKIVVNEVVMKNIPVATRKITSIDEYRRVVPKKINEEHMECVMTNSGYIAYFKGCGSMAMATIIPDLDTGVIDYSKRYQFLYDNLITTSIGKLSYQDFCARTSVKDLDPAVLTVLRVSDPDENEIVLTCGNEKCKRDYTVSYRLSELLDPTSISKEMGEAIGEIVAAKDIKEKAELVHKNSPVMTKKYVQFQREHETLTVVLKNTDGVTMIDRATAIEELSGKYHPILLGFLIYIPSIFLEFTLDGETEPSVYEITDPTVIVEKLGELNSVETHALGEALDSVVEYNPPKYSFRGDYVCPHCGRTEKEIPCTVDNLVFYKVGTAIR